VGGVFMKKVLGFCFCMFFSAMLFAEFSWGSSVLDVITRHGSPDKILQGGSVLVYHKEAMPSSDSQNRMYIFKDNGLVSITQELSDSSFQDVFNALLSVLGKPSLAHDTIFWTNSSTNSVYMLMSTQYNFVFTVSSISFVGGL
jgi:hypothetical protein